MNVENLLTGGAVVNAERDSSESLHRLPPSAPAGTGAVFARPRNSLLRDVCQASGPARLSRARREGLGRWLGRTSSGGTQGCQRRVTHEIGRLLSRRPSQTDFREVGILREGHR